jgi:ATP-dependent DNA helicase PIF1
MFKIPFEIVDDSISTIPKNSSLAKLLKATVLIIWDKCSAQHCFMFKAVNCTLRDLCNADGLFSGIMMVLGRDFLQTLPVIKTNLHSPIVHACLLSSSLWPAIKDFILKLERNMQVGPSTKEQSFATWLRQLATGTLNLDDETVALPRRILCPSDTIDDLVTHIYPNISHPHPASYFKECCILAPCNTETNDLNINVLCSFPGKEYKLWAIDHALNHETFLEEDTNYSPEVLHTFTPLGFPVAQLILKVGCPIMILQNLQPREGVCNGSRGIVTEISTRILQVHLFSGTRVLVPQIKMISANPDILFKLHRLQFLVSLSFTMTINKSQGQTFEVVGIDLQHPVFTHRQLYVALLRACHLSSLKCITNECDETERTKIIIFREVDI